eukprot:1161190-Pelagomonas_calceolata.AAC.15
MVVFAAQGILVGMSTWVGHNSVVHDSSVRLIDWNLFPYLTFRVAIVAPVLAEFFLKGCYCSLAVCWPFASVCPSRACQANHPPSMDLAQMASAALASALTCLADLNWPPPLDWLALYYTVSLCAPACAHRQA